MKIDSTEIARLAHKSGFGLAGGFVMPPAHTGHISHEIEAFAALVAAAQREIDAKLCDEQANEPECPERAAYCAAAIRANKD